MLFKYATIDLLSHRISSLTIYIYTPSFEFFLKSSRSCLIRIRFSIDFSLLSQTVYNSVLSIIIINQLVSSYNEISSFSDFYNLVPLSWSDCTKRHTHTETTYPAKVKVNIYVIDHRAVQRLSFIYMDYVLKKLEKWFNIFLLFSVNSIFSSHHQTGVHEPTFFRLW